MMGVFTDPSGFQDYPAGSGPGSASPLPIRNHQMEARRQTRLRRT